MRSSRFLSAPTYLVAFLFAFVPFLDLVVSVWPLQFGNLRWRVAMMGQLSGGLMTVLLGFLLALIAATVFDQPKVQRAIVALSGLMALALVVVMGMFVLDVFQLRGDVRPEVRRAFDMIALQAFIKLILALIGSLLFAWSGIRIARDDRKARRQRGAAEGPVVMVGGRGGGADARVG
jgi:chromate transport protein ChrA